MSTLTASAVPTSGKGLRIALWVGQVILAGMFTMSGLMKLNMTAEGLAQAMAGPLQPSLPLIKFIGIAEVAGVAGIILPALTRVLPRLTPLAAIGFFTILVLATGFHIVRGEFSYLPVTIGLALVALFVAWGRLKAAPIPPRS